MDVAAVIVAGGRGLRAGGGMPKQYRALAGVPVLRRAVDALLLLAARVQVVAHPDDFALAAEALAGLSLPPPVAGGATRQASVLAGLKAVGAADAVLIHDAARPLVPAAVARRVLAALAQADGAVPVLPVVDTLARDDGTAVARAGLWRVQTPQGFRFGPILGAHRAAAGGDATDDAGLARAAGLTVVPVEGDERAMKLTTSGDFARAEAWLAGDMATRAGTGFDVHRFGPGDHVMLCGVRVPHTHGVIAHSDGDVGLHALTDAVLGAAALGDIGQHFPPSDARWAGAASDRFLAHAAALVRAAGGSIEGVDVTIICERPKVGPHRDAMRASIAAILGVAERAVGVKATTTEGLGFTGRGEGIAAQAAATVRMPR